MLSQRAIAILRLLEQDLEDCGPGVLLAECATAAGTGWPETSIKQLRAAGHVIDERDGRYQLYSASSEPSTTAAPPAAGRSPGQHVGGSLDADQLALDCERAA